MFFKKLDSGKYRYYEKYWHTQEEKWKQVSVTLNSKTRAAQAEARRKLEEKIEKQNNVYQRNGKIGTVKEVFDEWQIIRKMELKSSTFRMQAGVLVFFIKEFGVFSIAKVKSNELQSYLLNHEWSPSYRNLVKTYLSLFFNYALTVGYITDNPMDRVVLPKLKLTYEEREKKKEKYLTQEQMKLYLKELYRRGNNQVFNILVEFLYLTGLRIGEAQALRWSDVDLENKVIHVSHTLERGTRKKDFRITTPKTIHAYRDVYFTDRVLELLKRLHELSGGDKELVFCDSKGDFVTMNGFNVYIKKFFDYEKMGKPASFSLSSHVFRHSHISLLTELGFSIKEIMERVGHGDETTTIGVYTHVTQTMQRNSIEKLNKVELNF